MNEQDLIKRGLEIYGSQWELGSKLGYISKHGRGSAIRRVLEGKGHLPQWRLERLQLLIQRHEST